VKKADNDLLKQAVESDAKAVTEPALGIAPMNVANWKCEMGLADARGGHEEQASRPAPPLAGHELLDVAAGDGAGAEELVARRLRSLADVEVVEPAVAVARRHSGPASSRRGLASRRAAPAAPSASTTHPLPPHSGQGSGAAT
jgi:hypothetical protein